MSPPTTIESLSTETAPAVAALIDKLSPGISTALDPDDPVDRAAITAALAAAGRDAARYPILHAALAGRGAPSDEGTDGGTDRVRRIDLGADADGHATATTWFAAGEGHLYSGGTVFALDGKENAVLAVGHNSNVGEGFVPVSTQGATAQPAGATLRMVSVNHSVSDKGEVRFTALADADAVTTGDMNFNITLPTQNPVHGPNVQIAVGRIPGHTNTDVDYWFNEPSDMQNPYLIVPFAGNVIIPYQIGGSSTGQPIANAQLSTELFYVINGATNVVAMNTTYTQNFANAVTVGNSNQFQVVWSYPYVAGSSYTNTTSLVYNQVPLLNTGDTSYFAYTFQIPVVNAPTGFYTFTVCSKDTPEPASPQCFKILCDLTFIWHCLAEGTMVTLADGSEAPIEALDNSHRVRTGTDGGDIAVEGTTRGSHQSTPGGPAANVVYRLETDSGHQVTGTGQHLVQGADGGFIAFDALNVGDSIATADGTATVTACDPVAFDGQMYNLKLGNDADRAAGLAGAGACTFVANGIVVGDLMAQQADRRRRTRDMDYMRGHLPPELVTDYASAVADIRY